MLRTRIFIIFLVLIILGCNGGGNKQRDLSGLEGVWDMTLVKSGEIPWPSGPESWDGTFDVEVTIQQNSITLDSIPVEWSYDGHTLLLTINDSYKDSTPCGVGTIATTLSMTLPLSPTGTSASMSGSQSLYIETQNCDPIHANIALSGSMTKR